MNKFIKIIMLLFILFILPGCSNSKTSTTENIKSNSEVKINDNKLYNINKSDIINMLCSDEFEGRLVGSIGNQLAEKYIADKFNEINLEYVFNKSFYQTYKQVNVANMSDELIEVNNIIGKISGTNSKKAIVISAHLDHIGFKNEKIIRGAVDNASGISVLIDLASKFKEHIQTNTPQYDIIFCAFNGEEKGLFGSKAFIEAIEGDYDNIYNINMDSIGYENGGNIILANSYQLAGNTIDSESYILFLDMLKKSFNTNSLTVSDSIIHVKSDDYSFQEKDIIAITITEENIWDVIHTPNDIPEILDYNKLDLISNSIYDFILEFLNNI